MSIARRMTAEEILSLPQGSVVWYEDRFIYDNAEEGVCGIPAYFLYPIMVAEAGKDFALIGAREGCCPQTWLPKDLPFMVIWDKKPDRKQLKGFYHWDIDSLSEDDRKLWNRRDRPEKACCLGIWQRDRFRALHEDESAHPVEEIKREGGIQV